MKTQKANFWDFLIAPHPRVTDPESIQRSRLLSAILLVLLLLGAMILTLVLQLDPRDINDPTVQGAIILFGISAGMYAASRLGYVRFAATGLILPFVCIFIYIPFFSGKGPHFLAFLIIPLILAAMFFSLRGTMVISIAILAVTFVLMSYQDQVSPTSPFWNLRNMWFFLTLATGLMLTFMWHQGSLEAIRQRELKRANEQLEQDIALRLKAEAEREKLIAELEAKNAELERFTYTVSHDLKSPLITMRGFLGYLERDALNGNLDRMKGDIARIIQATDKMQRLLNELLELSRIGRTMNPLQTVPFETIVREAIELVRGRIETRGIQVTIEPGLPVVHGDRARLVEVVQNLVENACKFMGQQLEPCITIGSRGIDRDGKGIFFVSDNGVGIAPEYHDRVFGLFNKLDAQAEGTGVGLALVKRIVEVHGGRVWVESEGARQGAVFCFTLPL